jgi:hypothetical protein
MALTSQALTTLAVLKSELGISGSTEDTYLERLIERASQGLQSALDRSVYYEEDIVEYVTGGGTSLLIVDRTPITSISSIIYDTGSGTTTTVDATDYRIAAAASGLIERVGGVWPDTSDRTGVLLDPVTSTQRRSIKVTYTGGWVTPQQADDDGSLTRDLPYDIEDAVLQFAVQHYREKGRDTSVKSIKALKTSVTWHDHGAGSMPRAMQRVVDRYARRLVL